MNSTMTRGDGQLLGRKNSQGNFFDTQIFAAMIPEDHPLVMIKRKVSFDFVEPFTASLYDPCNGRPSYPPEILFRVLFIETWAGLSDIQVCQQLKYNVLYRHFCEIGWDDPIPDDTTLVVFRRRLGQDKFRQLFDRIVDDARTKKCLKGEWALIDGTRVIAHAAQRGTVTLLRQVRRKLQAELEKVQPERAEQLEEQAEPLLENDFANQEELLAAEALKTMAMAESLKDVPQLDAVRAEIDAIIDGGQKSLADPDARNGYQKKDEPFYGYKVIATANENGLVEAVDVKPGNESEMNQLESQLDQLEERDIRPKRLAADKGYDSQDNRETAAEHGIKPYIPERKKAGKAKDSEGLIFQYDRRRDALVCPLGKRSSSKTASGNGFVFGFLAGDCRNCPLKARRLRETRKARQVYMVLDTGDRKPRGMKRAMRLRKTIERVFGEAKVWHGMHRARYRGLERVTVQVLMTFLVMNVKKMANATS